jgi:hypothetical protein
MDTLPSSPLDRFRGLLQRAGIDQQKPLHAVLITVFEAAQKTQTAVQEGRKPWTRDETRELVQQLDQTLLYRWTQFNRWGIAIGVGIVLLFGALCGVGGWFYGSAPVVAGISAGAEQCHDQRDGSQLCWIPIYKRLPAATYETTPGRR